MIKGPPLLSLSLSRPGTVRSHYGAMPYRIGKDLGLDPTLFANMRPIFRSADGDAGPPGVLQALSKSASWRCTRSRRGVG
jgi:hypothetical protein